VLRENIGEHAASLRSKARLGGILVPVGFVLFVIGGISMAASGSFGFPVPVLIGFFAFGAGGFMSAVYGGQAAAAGAYVSLQNQVRSADKTLINNLSFTPAQREADTLNAVKGLIRTGNLPGYEVIADMMVAKSSLGIRPEDIAVGGGGESKVVLVSKSSSAPAKCPSCGAAPRSAGKFCEYCGTKLA